MKKILLLIILFMPIFSNGQTLQELYDKLVSKNKNEVSKLQFKYVSYDIVTLNSTSNEFWKGGSSREAINVKLPVGTLKWYYRITLMEVEQNYFYNTNETLISLLQNNNPLFVNNQTSLGVNFYIINDYAKNDFLSGRTFNHYPAYQNENTRGFNGICDLTFSNLMICLKNNNLKNGLKAIVEVVAYGNF